MEDIDILCPFTMSVQSQYNMKTRNKCRGENDLGPGKNNIVIQILPSDKAEKCWVDRIKMLADRVIKRQTAWYWFGHALKLNQLYTMLEKE